MKYFKNRPCVELNHRLQLALVISIIFAIIFIQNIQAADFGSRDLSIGETWNLGNGFSITAQSIDAKAVPKQVWLVLSDSGTKLDDKVLAEGSIYNYNNIFITTVANIWSEPAGDKVRLTNTFTARPLLTVAPTAALTAAGPGKFRVAPTVRLRPVTDVIGANQDGIAELIIENPSLNDVALNVDISVSMPTGIHVYGESFVQVAGARQVHGMFSVPPGTSRTITIVVKADKSAGVGLHTIQFNGLYWPGGNKDAYQSVGLTYAVNVKEASNNPESAEPSTPTPTITPTPILTPTLAPTIGKELNTKSQLSEGLKYFAFPALVSLVVLGLVFIFEKREKNKRMFRDDLKTRYWFGYYALLIGYFVTGTIFAIVSFTVFFKELPASFDAGKFFFTIPIFYLSISSFILTIGLRVSKAIIKLNSFHLFISLLLGIFFIFVVLTDPQKSAPVIFPILLFISSGMSVWYDRIAIFRPEHHQVLSSAQMREEKSILEPDIKRGYTVLPNNDIKFGIRVTNSTGYTITDVDTIIDYTEELFKLKKSKIQRIGNIPPETARTAEYILKPLGCIHNEKINALISYTDATGKKHALHMRPKEVHCVCPFLKEKPMSEGEYSRLAAGSEYMQEGISFKGISVEELAKFMGETCRHMLYKVKEYDLEGKKVIYLSGESLGEKAYYLLTAVIQDYKGLTQVVLRAHSDKKYGLNGFMNEMADSIRHLVGSVQSAKEIGIIENTQVINIIDSVVQRTSFEMGEGGKTKVNIRESMVQRSTIGASTRKCPNCGREVEANEKFCLECGAKL